MFSAICHFPGPDDSIAEDNLNSSKSNKGAIPKARVDPVLREKQPEAPQQKETKMATPTRMTSMPGPAPFDDHPEAQQERDSCDYTQRITIEQAR